MSKLQPDMKTWFSKSAHFIQIGQLIFTHVAYGIVKMQKGFAPNSHTCSHLLNASKVS